MGWIGYSVKSPTHKKLLKNFTTGYYGSLQNKQKPQKAWIRDTIVAAPTPRKQLNKQKY